MLRPVDEGGPNEYSVLKERVSNLASDGFKSRLLENFFFKASEKLFPNGYNGYISVLHDKEEASLSAIREFENNFLSYRVVWKLKPGKLCFPPRGIDFPFADREKYLSSAIDSIFRNHTLEVVREGVYGCLHNKKFVVMDRKTEEGSGLEFIVVGSSTGSPEGLVYTFEESDSFEQIIGFINIFLRNIN